MVLVIKSLFSYCRRILNENEDPRVAELPWLGYHCPLIIVGLYLLFVFKWGPAFMANRKPFRLRTIMNIYNVFQITFNLIFGVVALKNSYFVRDYSFSCQTINHNNREPYMMALIQATHWYFLNKIVDLFDTIFFVLRKKYNQISFLHIYHHAGMIFAVYIHTKFLSGSHPTMLGIVNGFVHVFMYTYYLLAAFKPNVKNSIWWKKYITQIQLLQFAYLSIHFMFPLIDNNCTLPKWIPLVGITQSIFMFFLFLDFYYKSYILKKHKT